MAASGSLLPNTHRIEAGVGGTLSLYVENMTDTKIVFNGDTASGRAQWVPWLRSLALTLDEWAWSVLQNDVLPHGKVKKIMEKRPASRTDEEKEDLADTLEEACKGRDARKSKKSISDWKEEMSGDPGAFCTVIRDTERFLIQTLQSLTAGEANNIVLGIQISDECGRKAFDALKNVYGRAKEDDTNVLIGRLRGGLTFAAGDGFRSVEEGDDIAVHIRVLEDLRARIEATKTSIADVNVVNYVEVMLSEANCEAA